WHRARPPLLPSLPLPAPCPDGDCTSCDSVRSAAAESAPDPYAGPPTACPPGWAACQNRDRPNSDRQTVLPPPCLPLLVAPSADDNTNTPSWPLTSGHQGKFHSLTNSVNALW